MRLMGKKTRTEGEEMKTLETERLILRKFKIEDAMNATKAAIEEGIVPGGGISFINAYKQLKEEIFDTDAFVVLNGLFAVRDQILFNAGVDDISNENIYNGFDAQKMEWCDDMIANGIINPAKSDRLALENAISVLNLYLSSSCLITNEEVSF